MSKTGIYHNVPLYAPLKRPPAVADRQPLKQAPTHPATRQERAGSACRACTSAHARAQPSRHHTRR
ncbi:hypothetical protein CAZ29_32480, partial [Pseudomonas aeruginosa]